MYFEKYFQKYPNNKSGKGNYKLSRQSQASLVPFGVYKVLSSVVNLITGSFRLVVDVDSEANPAISVVVRVPDSKDGPHTPRL